jgi:hypothetical protein
MYAGALAVLRRQNGHRAIAAGSLGLVDVAKKVARKSAGIAHELPSDELPS